MTRDDARVDYRAISRGHERVYGIRRRYAIHDQDAGLKGDACYTRRGLATANAGPARHAQAVIGYRATS